MTPIIGNFELGFHYTHPTSLLFALIYKYRYVQSARVTMQSLKSELSYKNQLKNQLARPTSSNAAANTASISIRSTPDKLAQTSKKRPFIATQPTTSMPPNMRLVPNRGSSMSSNGAYLRAFVFPHNSILDISFWVNCEKIQLKFVAAAVTPQTSIPSICTTYLQVLCLLPPSLTHRHPRAYRQAVKRCQWETKASDGPRPII